MSSVMSKPSLAEVPSEEERECENDENENTNQPPVITIEDVDSPDRQAISFFPEKNGAALALDPSKKKASCSQLCSQCCGNLMSFAKRNLAIRNFFQHRSDYSLFLLSPNNFCRQLLLEVVNHPRFDNCVLVVIIANCIAIALESPSIEEGSFERKALDVANYVFNAVFGFEALLKILAYGFVSGQGTYLRNGWNVLDFFLISLSSIDMILGAFESTAGSTKILEIFRVLRLLRALRPLRVINRAPGLKIVVQTLALSVKPIGNIGIVFLYFFSNISNRFFSSLSFF